MKRLYDDPSSALLVGLSEDLARELQKPLALFCKRIHAVQPRCGPETLRAVNEMQAQILFCGPVVETVSQLRTMQPDTPIVVVSRRPEMVNWLDSIEAGASEYCAAPFDPAQVKWILDSAARAMRSA
jgi:DNA-binding NtrC family response regulator